MIRRLRCACGRDFAGPDTHKASRDYWTHYRNCPTVRGNKFLKEKTR